jgi:hypothetical protein
MRNSILLLAAVVSGCLAATSGQATKSDPAEKLGDAKYDIVVYGDSSAAVTAAVQAGRMNRSVILVNPKSFPGGMSSSGLGASDFGSRSSIQLSYG